jgi:hypothetical protein
MGKHHVEARDLCAAVEHVANATGYDIAMPRWMPTEGTWWATIERRDDGAVVDYLAVHAALGEDGTSYTCRGDFSLIQQFNRALEHVTAARQ